MGIGLEPARRGAQRFEVQSKPRTQGAWFENGAQSENEK